MSVASLLNKTKLWAHARVNTIHVNDILQTEPVSFTASTGCTGCVVNISEHFGSLYDINVQVQLSPPVLINIPILVGSIPSIHTHDPEVLTIIPAIFPGDDHFDIGISLLDTHGNITFTSLYSESLLNPVVVSFHFMYLK